MKHLKVEREAKTSSRVKKRNGGMKREKRGMVRECKKVLQVEREAKTRFEAEGREVEGMSGRNEEREKVRLRRISS